MNNRIQRKAGVILSYIVIITNTLIQLLYTPLLIRSLGQSEYGLYSLVASIISYLTILDLGFGNAIIVYTSKYRAKGEKEKEKKLHGMFKIIFIIIGIASALLSFILCLNANAIFGNTMNTIEIQKMKIMLIILSFNLFISFSFSIYSSIISAYEEFVYQKVVSLISSILKPLIMVPLLLIGFKSIALCIVITMVNVFVVLSNYYFCKRKLSISTRFVGFDKKIFRIILGYSIWIFLAVIVDKVNWSVDNFILGAVSGTIAISIYSIASTINQLFISLSTAISGIMLPKVSKMIAQNASKEKLTREMIKVGRIQNYIIFLMCSGLVLFGKDFIIIWAGTGFEESYYVALLLVIPISIPLIQNLGLSIMQAMNKYKFKAVSTMIMSIINIIISIFFAKKWGATGAALGTCISLVVCNIVIINIYYYICLKLDIIKFWKSIIKQSIPFIIPILAIMIIMNITTFTGIMSFILYGSFYVIFFIITAYCFSMNSYEKEIVSNVLLKIGLGRKKNERNY